MNLFQHLGIESRCALLEATRRWPSRIMDPFTDKIKDQILIKSTSGWQIELVQTS